jgi:ABC-type uncharacterized transport system involved in gliding motility auxiliary subunit
MKRYLQKLDTLGLLILVATVIWYSITSVWSKWHLVLTIAGFLLMAVGIVANYKQIINTLGKRATKYTGNYVISVILVIALIAGLNYIGQRHAKRFDMTTSGRYTLAPQTLQVLDKLDKDLDIKAFFPGGQYAPLSELLIQYKVRSPHIHFEFIDPDKKPDVAKQYDVTVYGSIQNRRGSQLKFGTVVISYGGKREKVEKRTEEVLEEDLTNAIIKVGQTEAKKIYFIQGHDEKSPSDVEQYGYSAAKEALEKQAYKVSTVNLVSEGKVPSDAKVLIEAGPKKEPFAQELQFINDFLNKGGSVLVMVDPKSPSLEPFLKNWGVQADNDVVLDVSGLGRLAGFNESIPLVLEYESHKITDRFKFMTFFQLVRSIQPDKNIPSGTTVETLFKSNPNSWGETDLNSPKASFDSKTDLKGPLSLAVAVTREIKAEAGKQPAKARMVVVGDSDFPMNAYFAAQGNGNLFLNMVSWLAEDENLISIRPKPPEDRRITISQSQSSALQLFTLIILPGLVLVIGIIVWTRRRK